MKESTENTRKQMEEYREKVNRQRGEIQKRIVGLPSFIESLFICFYSYSEGDLVPHILVEAGVGTGKTATLKTFAKTISEAKFNRIQFTADMLPERVYRIVKFKGGEQKEYPGPIFANLVLADEINRASPRGKSGLLEAMGEQQVTFEGETYNLETPFFIMATENPVETVGTYPLGWAEADRFMMKVYLEPHTEEEKKKIARLHRQKMPEIEPVVTKKETLEIKEFIRKNIFVDSKIEEQIIRIVGALSPEGILKPPPEGIISSEEFDFYPEGERGYLFLERATQVRAFLRGRDYVNMEDVVSQVFPTLNHRLEFKYHHGRYEKIQKLKEILSECVVKVARDGIGQD